MPRPSAVLDQRKVKEAMLAAGIDSYAALSDYANISQSTIDRLLRNERMSFETIGFLCSALRCQASDILPLTITLASNGTDSAILTGESLTPRGNYRANAPFGFRASLHLGVSAPCTLVSFECLLFRERTIKLHNPSATVEEFIDRDRESIGEEVVRDYARSTAILTYGPHIHGGGTIENSVAPSMNATTLMFSINDVDANVKSDLRTLSVPHLMHADSTNLLRYTRFCLPSEQDETPADYIYNSSIEVRLGLAEVGSTTLASFVRVFDYNAAGSLSPRMEGTE